MVRCRKALFTDEASWASRSGVRFHERGPVRRSLILPALPLDGPPHQLGARVGIAERRDVGPMPQDRLPRGDLGAPVEHVRRASMTTHVRMKLDPRLPAVALAEVLDPARR